MMTSFTRLLADARPSFSSRLFVYRQGEPEPWKDSACERDDLRDDAFFNSQHIERQRSPRGIAWTQYVVGHRRLQIGTCEDAAKATEALRPKAYVNPELQHGVPTNNDAGLRGHSKDGVVTDDRRECFKVTLLARIDDFLQE